MVGLDAAGKTTILYKLKLGEIVTTIPTIGETSTSLLLPDIQGLCLPLSRFQRRDCRIQEHPVHRMGCWWTRQDQTPMETLLPKHPRHHLRR
jgi:GTPase SAR1 family protein